MRGREASPDTSSLLNEVTSTARARKPVTGDLAADLGEVALTDSVEGDAIDDSAATDLGQLTPGDTGQAADTAEDLALDLDDAVPSDAADTDDDGADLAADLTETATSEPVQVDAVGEDLAVDEESVIRDEVADVSGDPSEWLAEVNPLSNFEAGGSQNCGSCALAVDSRLDGSDPTAVAGDFTLDGAEMEAMTGRPQEAATPEQIEAGLLEAGPGAKTIVGIDRVDGPGHWFNAYNDGGRIKWIDGQTAQQGDWPPTNLGNVSVWDWNGAS